MSKVKTKSINQYIMFKFILCVPLAIFIIINLVILFFNHNNLLDHIKSLYNYDTNYIQSEQKQEESLITIVTAYFPADPNERNLRSKHTLDEYQNWLNNFLHLSFQQNNMYIYTTPQQYPYLAYLRYKSLFSPEQMKSPTDFSINQVNLYTDLPLNTTINTYWNISFNSPFEIPSILPLLYQLTEIQPKMDPEYEAHHSPFLYAIWHGKPWMMHNALSLNPFQSKYFAWIDAGSFRDYILPEKWPSPTRWQETFEHYPHRILYGIMNKLPFQDPFLNEEYCKEQHYNKQYHNQKFNPMKDYIDPIYSKKKAQQDFVQGTYFAGDKQAIELYYKVYYDTLNYYMAKNWLFATEQTIMSSLVLTWSHFFIVLDASPYKWFFFPLFFSSIVADNNKQNIEFNISLNIKGAEEICFS